MIVLDDDVKKAIERIALTPDGRVLHLGLQRSLMALAPSVDGGALQAFEGGRRFAANLKALMDGALKEQASVGRSGNIAEHERPIVIVSRGPVAAGGGHRGARRRVSAAADAGNGA